MRKFTKGVTSVALSAALTLWLVGCSSGTLTAADFKGQTVVCQVESINGNEITATIGELSDAQGANSEATASQNSEQAQGGNQPQGENQGDGQTPPDKPEGEGDSTDSAQAQGDSQTPPDKPEGEASDSNQDEGQSSDQTPPDLPSDDTSSSTQSSDQTPPDLPSGDTQGGNAPSDMDGGQPSGQGGFGMQTFTAGDQQATFDLANLEISQQGGPGTSNETLTVSDLSEGTVLSLTIDDSGEIESATVVSVAGEGSQNGQGGQGGNFGGSGTVQQGTAANTMSEDGTYENETYESTGDDENALRVTDATVTLSNITVDKKSGSSSNTEDGDFYGMNAALLATDGAQVTIKNATVTSSAQNGNGVFSYGEGTVVTIEDSTIKTSENNSGGIQTTGGATMNAKNLTIETQGTSSAAIRSDRGGGTVTVEGGTYTSNGIGSPAIYSTAAISVKNATLTANNSEALVIEGKNSIELENCTIEGNMTKSTGGDEDVLHNVMVYQSMSGDADEGTSTLSINGGTMTSNNGDVFYVTNTHAIMKLANLSIINKDTDSYLLNVSGNNASRGWGTAGANGGQLELTASQQTLEGKVIVDTVSTLSFTLTDASTFTGTLNIVENAEGGQAVSDNAVVTIGAGCTWNLTGDCSITSLDNQGTINFNGHTITLADGTVLS
jgi:hypothetical protein